MSTTPAGWYDDGSGRQRWWDGTAWTDQFSDHADAADAPRDPNTIWDAVGKPLKGFGGGRYRLTKEYLFFEKGMVTTKAQQIPVHEIFDVDMRQSMTQKARGVGDITLRAVRSSGEGEVVVIEDIAGFREGVTALNRVAYEARESLRQRQQTQTIQYTGVVPSPQAAAAPAPAAMDLNAELAKLAAFREQGVLDEDEFKAAKAKLLGIG